MLTYDLMLILSGNAEPARRAEIASEADALIAKGGGTILEKIEWGERPLAFDIDHEAVGEYRMVRFEGPPESLEAITRQLNITEGLLRHRIIKAVPGAPTTVNYAATASVAAPAAPAPAAAPAPVAAAPVAAEAAAEPVASEPAAPAETPEVAEATPEATEPAAEAPEAAE